MDNIVRNFAHDLVRHRKYNYSQQPLEEFLMIHSDIQCQTFRVRNPQGYHLETLLLKRSHHHSCILYAHGLGSNKLQCLPVAKYFMRQGFDICSFDFSGSGRSEGQCITYGVNQRADLQTILRHISSIKLYDRIVLWGRSMGAVAVVLSQQFQEHPKVDCLILDSPFSSFERIAIEIASKKSLIPQFMLQVLIEPLKEFFKDHRQINPFTVDLSKILPKIKNKILLIYSTTDSVVSTQHFQNIKDCCRKTPTEIIIKEDHNQQRSTSTLKKTLVFIKDIPKQPSRNTICSQVKNRGISVTSKEAHERQSVRSVSKIRLTQASHSKMSSRGHNSKPERHIRTVASIQDCMETSERVQRMQTQHSSNSSRRGKSRICSMFLQSKLAQQRMCANKENKPSLNLLRRNRFR